MIGYLAIKIQEVKLGTSELIMVFLYDFTFDLPFPLGLNLETISFALNLCIPLMYFLLFWFMLKKFRGFEKTAPYYTFVKSLVYFFFFYGIGGVWLLYYDFFYMDLTSPNPISVIQGSFTAPPIEVTQLWLIGVLLQNIGLFLMINQLRGKVFQSRFWNVAPLVWEIIGFIGLICIGWVLPLEAADRYFWVEVIFLFNFTWSICLPITYGVVYKNAAGILRRYAFILFVFFLTYGLAWGFRTRFAVYLSIEIIPTLTYPLIWTIRAGIMVFSLILCLLAYQKLLKSM